MLEFFHSKLVFAIALCLVIFLPDTHVDASALKFKDSYEESLWESSYKTYDDKKSTEELTGTKTHRNKPIECRRFKIWYVHPDDCSKFYTCHNYLPTLRTCPEGKLFDANTNQCRPDREVNCGSRKRPIVKTTIGTTRIATSPELTTKLPTTTPPTTPQPTTTQPTTPQPTTTPPSPKPTGPTKTDCDENDLDCIIKETGDITKWFECPEAVGSFRHPSNNKLFIFCKNWRPLVKKCGLVSVYSEAMKTCVTP